MGLLAVDGRALWRHVVEPEPGRFAFAARLALACAITAVVTAVFQMPSPALTTYVAFFVNKPDRMETIVLCVVMTILITLILGFTIAVAQLVADSSAWRVAAMTAISFGMLFLVSASKLRPIGGIVALISAYGLDLLGSVQSGDAATRTLMYPWLFVATPAGVSAVGALLLAPSPRRLAERTLARWLRTAVAVLREPAGPALAELGKLLRGGDVEVAARLKLAGVERTSNPAALAALRQAADATFALVSAIDVMARSPLAMLPESVRDALARAVEPAAAAFERGEHPQAVALPPLGPPGAVAASTWAAAATWAAIDDALAKLASAPVAPPPAAAPPAQAAAPKKPGGFLAPDALTNPEHVQFALKTTFAAMFCYLTYSILDWREIHTCFITCFIVALPALADSLEKLWLRIAGCLVGAGLGTATMVYVVPSFTSVTALFLIVLAGALVATWIAAGSPRIAYAGFQIAFAYFLCVVQDAGPAFDLVVARDRVIGMLFGILVMYAVSSRVWPVSVARRIEAGIRGAVHSLVEMAKASGDAARVRLAARAIAALGAAQDDLAVVGYEPASVRPSARWLELRRAMVAEAEALEGPLLLSARSGDAAAAEVAGRLERLADASAVASAPAAGHDTSPLDAIMEPHLAALEATAAAVHRLDGGAHAVA